MGRRVAFFALAIAVACGPTIESATTPSPRTAAPAPIITAPPTTAPALISAVPTTPNPGGVVFTSVSSPVRRGQMATAAIATVPFRTCTITVSYASGPSRAQGLEPKTADGNGKASWSWLVGANTTPGSWPIDVTCGNASARAFFTVQ